jgi:exodeoxyribonuclease VII large subunit
MVTQYEQKIDDLRKDMAIRIDHTVKMRSEGFARVTGKLEALNPLAILNRGYSVTVKLPTRGIVKDSSALSVGDNIETKFGKGYVRSKIEEVG